MHAHDIFRNIKILIVLSLCLLSLACGGGTTEAVNDAGDTGVTGVTGVTGDTGVIRVADGTGSIQVAWNAPVEYTDGSPLSLADIASYKLRYGTEPGNYTAVINIDDPSITKYAIEGLKDGAYYLSVTVQLNNGLESGYSNEIFREI